MIEMTPIDKIGIIMTVTAEGAADDMKHMKYMLTNRRGLSNLEAFCITGIVLLLLVVALEIYHFQVEGYRSGDDGLKMSTAESVARVNTVAGGCVVTDCDGRAKGYDARYKKGCEHLVREGVTRGYYDPVEKKIYGEKPEGYNESGFHKNTYVIQVECRDGDIRCTWVEGK